MQQFFDVSKPRAINSTLQGATICDKTYTRQVAAHLHNAIWSLGQSKEYSPPLLLQLKGNQQQQSHRLLERRCNHFKAQKEAFLLIFSHEN